MTQARNMMLGVAVAALIFGVSSTTPLPYEDDSSLSNADILVVTNESDPVAGQTEENAEDSAKIGKEEGTHSGDQQGETPEGQASKMTGSDNDPNAGSEQPQKN